MNRKFEIVIEKAIARLVVETVIKHGWEVSVFDGEEYPLRKSKDVEAVMKALMSTDEDRLDLHRNDGGVLSRAWIKFVWGNVEDCISDFTESLSALIDPIMDASDDPAFLFQREAQALTALADVAPFILDAMAQVGTLCVRDGAFGKLNEGLMAMERLAVPMPKSPYGGKRR